MLLALLLFSSCCLHALGTFTEVVLSVIFSLAVREIALFITNSQRSKMHPCILMFSGMDCCECNAAFSARSVLLYHFLNLAVRSDLAHSPNQTHLCLETLTDHGESRRHFTNMKAKASASQTCVTTVLHVVWGMDRVVIFICCNSAWCSRGCCSGSQGVRKQLEFEAAGHVHE